jgi:DNA-binding MarR family transcriptional regulator
MTKRSKAEIREGIKRSAQVSEKERRDYEKATQFLYRMTKGSTQQEIPTKPSAPDVSPKQEQKPIESPHSESTQIEAAQPETIQQKPVGPSNPTDNLWIKSDYTQVVNEIIDSLQPALTPQEFSVYLFMYRASWGYHTNVFKLSLPKIADHCHLGHATVTRCVSHLIKKGYLHRYRTDHKKGTTYVVFLPHGAEYEVVASQGVDSEGVDSERDGSRLTVRRLLINLNKHNKQTEKTPCSPPVSGGPPDKLKIKTGRWPRKPVDWEPWDEIRTRLQETLSYRDFRPLSRATTAARGLGQSIHVRGDGLTPEVLSDSLTTALATELLAHGIDTLRIAV